MEADAFVRVIFEIGSIQITDSILTVWLILFVLAISGFWLSRNNDRGFFKLLQKAQYRWLNPSCMKYYRSIVKY